MVKPAVKAVLVEDVAAGKAADEVAGGERGETDDAVGGRIVVGVSVAVGEEAIEMKVMGERGNIRERETVVGGGRGGGEERAEKGDEIGEEREKEERERVVGEIVELAL